MYQKCFCSFFITFCCDIWRIFTHYMSHFTLFFFFFFLQMRSETHPLPVSSICLSYTETTVTRALTHCLCAHVCLHVCVWAMTSFIVCRWCWQWQRKCVCLCVYVCVSLPRPTVGSAPSRTDTHMYTSHWFHKDLVKIVCKVGPKLNKTGRKLGKCILHQSQCCTLQF